MIFQYLVQIEKSLDS